MTTSERLSAVRLRALDRHRQRRFARLIAEILGDDQRVTRQQLSVLCMEAFKAGYNAGYQRIRMKVKRHPEQAMSVGAGPCG